MTSEEMLLQAEAVLKEAERQGFTNTAAAMIEVINGFQVAFDKAELRRLNRVDEMQD